MSLGNTSERLFQRPRDAGLLDVVLTVVGILLLLLGVSIDWSSFLLLIHFPARELSNPWVRADLSALRAVCVVIGIALVVSRFVLWRCAEAVAALWSTVADMATEAAARWSALLFLSVTTMILVKTVLQLGLFVAGYEAYSADDFSRTLSADYWRYFHKFDLGMNGWIGLRGSGWLPFPDYLFSLGLALHRDLFFTPRIVNLVISGCAVVVAYFLGRELFGRVAGLLTAFLFAFQPWHVWLGLSGMTSDLPSVVLIALFGLFLVRWLRTDQCRSMLAAAAALGVANGFRYENWFFSLVFSAVVLVIGFFRWRRTNLPSRRAAAAAGAIAVVNAVPIFWMTVSYIRLGSWLPTLHTNMNAFYTVAFTAPSPTTIAPSINMAVLAVGAFPLELAVSLAGVAWFLVADGRPPVSRYVAIVVGTLLVFGVVLKGRLPAYFMCARYFLPYVVLLLPFGGFLVARLLSARHPWRYEGMMAAGLVVLATAVLDTGRAFNFPVPVPQDALDTGWTIRRLQHARTIPESGRILLERTMDWGDLGIVVLANRPERFVALNDPYEQALDRSARSTGLFTTAFTGPAGVLPKVCQTGFQAWACQKTLRDDGFDLVILSSGWRIQSFQQTFDAHWWRIGRYYIFDMSSVQSAKESSEARPRNDRRVASGDALP